MRSAGGADPSARVGGRDGGYPHWQHRWDDRSTGLAAPEWPGARAARVWIPVVISALAQIPYAVIRLVRPGAFEVDDRTALIALLVAAVGPAALIAARRYPGVVVAVVCAAASADLLVTGRESGPPYVALAFAVVGAIVRGARVWAWASIATAWIATLVLGSVFGIDWRPFAVAGTTFGILVVVGIGESIRSRRERYLQTGRELAERRLTEVQAERVRIARELHDVLAHSLSQINVQAGVGLHLMERQPEKAAEALANIKETSKSALDEVRSVLGVLRAEEGADPTAPLVPEPDLSRLPGLVASVSSQGVAVTLEDSVVTPPPAAVSLAVYRIVQESLTNVFRHAAARRAHVTVTQERDELRVEIRDDGRGIPDEPSEGRGLLGMRERADLLGGSLRVDDIASGGTRVVARIPLRPTEEDA